MFYDGSRINRPGEIGMRGPCKHARPLAICPHFHLIGEPVRRLATFARATLGPLSF